MIDRLRIAHLRIAPPVGNPEVGNPDIHLNTWIKKKKLQRGCANDDGLHLNFPTD